MTIYQRIRELLNQGKDWWNKPAMPPGFKSGNSGFVPYRPPAENPNYVFMVDDNGRAQWIKRGSELDVSRYPAPRLQGETRAVIHNFNLPGLTNLSDEQLYSITRGGSSRDARPLPRAIPREQLMRDAYRAMSASPEDRERLANQYSMESAARRNRRVGLLNPKGEVAARLVQQSPDQPTRTFSDMFPWARRPQNTALQSPDTPSLYAASAASNPNSSFSSMSSAYSIDTPRVTPQGLLNRLQESYFDPTQAAYHNRPSGASDAYSALSSPGSTPLSSPRPNVAAMEPSMDLPIPQMSFLDRVKANFLGPIQTAFYRPSPVDIDRQSNGSRNRWSSSSSDVEMQPVGNPQEGRASRWPSQMLVAPTSGSPWQDAYANGDPQQLQEAINMRQMHAANYRNNQAPPGTNPLAPPSQFANNRMSLKPGQPNVNTLSSTNNPAKPPLGAGGQTPQAIQASGNMGMMMAAAPAMLGALMAVQNLHQQNQYYADQRQDINQQLRAADNNKRFSV